MSGVIHHSIRANVPCRRRSSYSSLSISSLDFSLSALTSALNCTKFQHSTGVKATRGRLTCLSKICFRCLTSCFRFCSAAPSSIALASSSFSAMSGYGPRKDVEELEVVRLGGGDGRPVTVLVASRDRRCCEEATVDVEACASGRLRPRDC